MQKTPRAVATCVFFRHSVRPSSSSRVTMKLIYFIMITKERILTIIFGEDKWCSCIWQQNVFRQVAQYGSFVCLYMLSNTETANSQNWSDGSGNLIMNNGKSGTYSKNSKIEQSSIKHSRFDSQDSNNLCRMPFLLFKSARKSIFSTQHDGPTRDLRVISLKNSKLFQFIHNDR